MRCWPKVTNTIARAFCFLFLLAGVDSRVMSSMSIVERFVECSFYLNEVVLRALMKTFTLGLVDRFVLHVLCRSNHGIPT